jgi:acyl dehydratase
MESTIMSRESIYFESIEVGDVIESIPRTIVESDIWLFAYLTADFFPIHTDIEFARKTPFGERIAQGMLVLSIALGMIDQVVLSRFDVSSVVAFFGIQNVRFLRPVFIGDTVKAISKVKEKVDRDENSGVVTYQLEVKNQRDETVLTADYSVLIRKTPLE